MARRLFLSLILVLPLGCATDDAVRPKGDPPSLLPTSPRAFLASPRTLSFGKGSDVTVTAHKDIGGEATEVASLAVTGGDLVLRADPDGSLAVDELVLALADVAIPSMNIGLTRLEVKLAAVDDARTAWSADDRTAVVTATVD